MYLKPLAFSKYTGDFNFLHLDLKLKAVICKQILKITGNGVIPKSSFVTYIKAVNYKYLKETELG